MFSSLSSLVWGSSEGNQERVNSDQVLFDDSKVTEDDWVLIEEIRNHGESAHEDRRVPSLQTLPEAKELQLSDSVEDNSAALGCSSRTDNTDLNATTSHGFLFTEKQSNISNKSSLEILFAEVQPNETESKEISDCSMKTDETDVGEKSSLQFLFDESFHGDTATGGQSAASQFFIKPMPDPPIIQVPSTSQPQRQFNHRSYSADYFRGNPDVVVEPTVLRRRHVSRLSKRSGDSASAMVGPVVVQKKTKLPPEGTSSVVHGDDTRKRTKRANSVACVQSNNTHGRRRKRTADKCSGKGGRRNC